MSDQKDYNQIKTYAELVKTAQDDYKKRLDDPSISFGKLEFQDCDEWQHGNQINIWTYWQGFQYADSIERKPIDILLVGQDWGNPRPDSVSLSRLKQGELAYDPFNPTDSTIIDLFEVLGINVKSRKPEKRVFFTNYCLGYRVGSETGNMKKRVMRMDKPVFDALVRILRPKYIICLGKFTYEVVVGKNVKGYLNVMRSGHCISSIRDDGTKVFCVPHAGARGISNLNGHSREKNMEIARNIWHEMKEKMEAEI